MQKYIKYIYIFLIFLYTAYSSYLTYLQYNTWKNSDLGKYFLPPHQTINYFASYSFYHFWSHFLAALIFSLVILFLAKFFNKRHHEQYFWPEEPYFIAIAILAVGYPGWLVYFSLILLVPFLWSGLLFLMRFFAEFTLRKLEGLRMTKKIFTLLRMTTKNSHPEASAEGSPKFERVSYYYLWLALAIFSILINEWLATFSWWAKLII